MNTGASWIISVFLAASCCLASAQPKVSREEGEFKILYRGDMIGSEKYVILSLEDSFSSSSILDFRNPEDKHQKIQLETKLEMGPRYLPRTYELRSDVDGKKGVMNGKFGSHQAMFEFTGGATPRKSGLLVGDQFTLLDTNIFHHFIFLARLYNYGSHDKPQKFEVVIPQEEDNGQVTLRELNTEALAVKGKKVETHHLQMDSGSVQIDLWVDNQRILHKIAVPAKGIEVLRNP